MNLLRLASILLSRASVFIDFNEQSNVINGRQRMGFKINTVFVKKKENALWSYNQVYW